MSEWKELELGEFCNIFTGKKDVNQTVKDGKYLFFSCSPIPFKSNEYIYDGKAIIIAGNGSYTGRVSKFNGKFDLYQRTYACTPLNNDINIDYVYWYMKLFFEPHFLGGTRGSSIPYIVKNDLASFVIRFPSIEKQDKIVSILSSLDDKIETNRAINARLEELAAAIFKSWFIDNSSNEEEAKIEDYLVPKRGKNLLTKDAKGGEVPVVAGGLEPSCYHNEANTKAPVITISASGANAGFVKIWSRSVWSADSSYIDTSITPFVYFWYNLLKNKQKQIYDSQTGSAQPHIYPYHISSITIARLDMVKVEEFNKLVTPFYEAIETNNTENNRLASLRDTLLPRLMSGEISVDSCPSLA